MRQKKTEWNFGKKVCQRRVERVMAIFLGGGEGNLDVRRGPWEEGTGQKCPKQTGVQTLGGREGKSKNRGSVGTKDRQRKWKGERAFSPLKCRSSTFHTPINKWLGGGRQREKKRNLLERGKQAASSGTTKRGETILSKMASINSLRTSTQAFLVRERGQIIDSGHHPTKEVWGGGVPQIWAQATTAG